MTLYLPQKISVGFQERQDTYTGKLGFVIYEDHTAKLRQEHSWNMWRNKEIPSEEFNNSPTHGFVLNKKAGDYSSRYGGRRAAIRVYDPRGFEFEIDVNNLLFILENCDAYKGKGLDGEFVYSWDKNKLFLLPINTQAYQDAINLQKFNFNYKKKKITKKDMEIGRFYRDKDNNELLYFGRDKYKEFSRTSFQTKDPAHIFYNKTQKCLEFKQGYRYIIDVLEKDLDSYHEFYPLFEAKHHTDRFIKKMRLCDEVDGSSSWHRNFVKHGEEMFYKITKFTQGRHYYLYKALFLEKDKILLGNPVILDESKIQFYRTIELTLDSGEKYKTPYL